MDPISTNITLRRDKSYQQINILLCKKEAIRREKERATRSSSALPVCALPQNCD